jgi:hypothetical protein
VNAHHVSPRAAAVHRTSSRRAGRSVSLLLAAGSPGSAFAAIPEHAAGAGTRTAGLPGWLSELTLTQTYLLLGAFGLSGLVFMIVGAAGIIRAGRRPSTRTRPDRYREDADSDSRGSTGDDDPAGDALTMLLPAIRHPSQHPRERWRPDRDQ